MVSSISPQQFGRPDQVDLVGAYLGGRQGAQTIKMNDQAIAQNEQQMDEAGYQQATKRLEVINRIARQVKSMPQESRAQFISSMNPEIFQSVGIDPAQVSSVQLDDNSLDALITQTASALPEGNQYRKESVNTNQGLMVFDPTTGTYVAAKGADGSPLRGAQYDPNIQASIASAKSNAANQSDQMYEPETQRRKREAEAQVDLATRPQIESEVTAARAGAEQAAAKRKSQEVASGKLNEVQSIYDKLNSADLDKIYGRGESVYPELLRSQEGIDLLANRDQLVALLKLGARGELQGQGTITDSETKMVADAVTILGNANISAATAKQALDRAMTVLKRSAGKGSSGTNEPSLEDLLSKY